MGTFNRFSSYFLVALNCQSIGFFGLFVFTQSALRDADIRKGIRSLERLIFEGAFVYMQLFGKVLDGLVKFPIT
jgi:hypothetical protein